MFAASDSPRTRSVTDRAWLEKKIAACPAELPAPIKIHIFSLRQTGIAARRTVVDAGADESIDRIDLEAPPLHAHRENDRPRPENVAPVQGDGHLDRVDAFDAAGHHDLSAQPLRLLQRPARELVPGDAIGNPV